MKYYATSDIHGFYDEFMAALKASGFNQEEDTLIVCGDLFDRGTQAAECLNYILNLPHKVCILGNHELLLQDLLKRGISYDLDESNGTILTCISLSETPGDYITGTKENKDLQEYFKLLVPYYEVGNNLFVHGWIPDTEYKTASTRNWELATWLNGIQEWHLGNKIKNKTIYCGHWNTSFGNFYYHHKGHGEYNKDSDFEPFIDNGIVALDACTALSGKVNVVYVGEF